MRTAKSKEYDVNLDALVIALLKRNQQNQCACGMSLDLGYQLTHRRYGPDITLYDLDLKCGACHALEHGLRKHTGTLRA
jgi:hypothetical protein